MRTSGLGILLDVTRTMGNWDYTEGVDNLVVLVAGQADSEGVSRQAEGRKPIASVPGSEEVSADAVPTVGWVVEVVDLTVGDGDDTLPCNKTVSIEAAGTGSCGVSSCAK